ncbi:MAG: hypothetical protein FJX67_06060 [Alphaproteobacteria bacterium]|nr:hypothetical protein [Alphaproteobacteria bacterium]
MAETGGRRGKGLVFVFSAANDDAPTFLEADQNINWVRFTRFTASGAAISEIRAGNRVFSGYPMTRGVVTVTRCPRSSARPAILAGDRMSR